MDLALLLAVLVPKTARGVAAALVQVTNTTANLVPTVAAEALNFFDYHEGKAWRGRREPRCSGHSEFQILRRVFT